MEPGTRLGPYEIQSQLGAGGMGEVYLAADTRLGREVAVKVLPSEFAADRERLARFDQEARAAAALNHPHIAVVYDVGEADGVHFLVQERLQGSTLREALSDGRLSREKCLSLGVEIAEALVAAHAAGIVHRDLKPDNIFVTESGHAKILDFGLAKLTQLAAPSGATSASMSPTALGTMTGAIMGTAGYMAPEQVEGLEVDSRADLFAFGCVLYEMAAGQRAFSGKNAHEILSRIISNEPATIAAHVPDAPVELQRIVRKCLAKDTELRYQHADDLVVDLRRLLRELDTEIATPRRPDGEAEIRSGLAPERVAALLAIAIVGAGAGTWLLKPAPTVEPGTVREFSFAFPASDPFQTFIGRNLAVSSGATQVAFFASASAQSVGGGKLFVRSLDSQQLRQIAGVVGSSPTFSPDDASVAYTTGASGSLRKVALEGGPSVDLGLDFLAGFPFWADDGYIYFRRFGDDPESSVLARVSEHGGDVETLVLTGAEDLGRPMHIWVLPGGRLAFVDLVGDDSLAGIGLVDLDTLETRKVVDYGSDPRWVPTGHLTWARAGVLYAARFDLETLRLVGPSVPVLRGVAMDPLGSAQVAFGDDGTLAWVPGAALDSTRFSSGLVFVDPDGSFSAASSREGRFRTPSLSPDESRVALAIDDNETEDRDVWVLDLEQDILTRVTSAGGYAPLWSRDGRWIYFNRDSDGAGTDIWRRRADFSAPAEPVIEKQGRQILSALTPEGDAVIYEEVIEGSDGRRQDDLWLFPLAGEARSLVESAEHEHDAAVSPDGRLLAYVSDESGQDQVYVREFAGSRRWTVSPDIGRAPRWSPDGARLYYVEEGGSSYAVVDVTFDADYRQSTPRSVQMPTGVGGIRDMRADGAVLALRVLPSVLDRRVEDSIQINVRLNWFQELERLAPREQ